MLQRLEPVPGNLARALSVRGAVLVAVSSVLAALLRFPFAFEQRAPGGDAATAIAAWETARASFRAGQGFPFLDRARCGGVPFLGDPATPFLSSLIAGLGVRGDVLARGLPIVGLAIGIIGFHLWARRVLRLRAGSAFFAAALFAASGWSAFHLVYRPPMIGIVGLPWVLLLARDGERDRRSAVVAGMVLASIVLEGGFPFAALVTTAALLTAQLPRIAFAEVAPRRVVEGLAIVLVVAVLVSGVKLVPATIQLLRHAPAGAASEPWKLADFAVMLGENNPLRDRGPEARAYVGPLAIGMAIAGAGTALILRPRRVEVALFVALGLLLSRGAEDGTPLAAIQELPILEHVLPAQWLALLVIGIAAAAGVAVDAAFDVVRGRTGRMLLAATALVAVLDPASTARTFLAKQPTALRLARPDPAPEAYRLESVEAPERRAQLPARGIGAVECASFTIAWPEAANFTIGAAAQVQVARGSAQASIGGDVTTIEIETDAPAPARVNQRWDADLVVSAGTLRKASNGQVEITTPPGRHRIELRHRPSGLVAGTVCTVIGLLLAATIALFGGFRARATTAARDIA